MNKKKEYKYSENIVRIVIIVLMEYKQCTDAGRHIRMQS